MRIIAGKVGGRRLVAPQTREIRPTAERAREAVFSILGDVGEAVVVDGFAGTGALGCEALSRGARLCYFMDTRASAIELIEQNLEHTDLGDRAVVLRGSFVDQLAMVDEDPDLWLLDPPYQQELGQPALEAMAQASCVTDKALVVLEQDKDDVLPHVDGFELEDERVYGRAKVSFWRFRAS